MDNFNSKPLVTIGLPVYNGERFLKNALDSLLSQTFKNFQIIISDNFSNDTTHQICQDYMKKDKRIRYFRQKKNIGIYKNYLFVLEKSNTKFFQWAAADDLWHDTFLEKNIQFLEKNPSFVGSIGQVGLYNKISNDWTKIVEKSHTDNHIQDTMVQSITGSLSDRFRTYLKLRQVSNIYAVYRTEILKESSFVNEKYIWDFLLVLKIILHGDVNAFDEILMVRFEGGESNSSTPLEYRVQNNLDLNYLLFPHLNFTISCFKIFGTKIFLKNFFWVGRYFLQGESQLIIDLFKILKKKLS